MKKAFTAVIIVWAAVIISIGVANIAGAEEVTAQIEFSYFGTADKAATSFNVRNNGAPVCLLDAAENVTGTPALYTASCLTEAFTEGDNNVTMVANLADNTQSPPSTVFEFFLDYQVSILTITLTRQDGSSQSFTIPVAAQ